MFIAGRHGRYSEVSAPGHGDLPRVTPLVEPLSLDEAFLDVAGAVRRLGPAPQIAAHIRERVLAEEGLTCSVGVAGTKFLAKLATETAKPEASPTGPASAPGSPWSSPPTPSPSCGHCPCSAVGRRPGHAGQLARMGVTTVGDLADLPEGVLVAALGRSPGRHLHAPRHGRDPRVVEPERR